MSFNAIRIIEQKRDGGAHSEEEIRSIVGAVCSGEMADYQISAWLMAVYFNGLDDEELRAFTDALSRSGETVELACRGSAVDKHSTGGVGDKTTLVVAPIVASCGLPVAKLSGRGLGFTGGTVDKLGSIPGMDMHLSNDAFVAQVERIGIAISGTSRDIAPAEGKLYALRDVTGTVPSIPLIASSIVSKKVAGGADAFVFDIKCGAGAFMNTIEDAEDLADALVSLSSSLGKRSACLISDMEQPLGEWAGNSAEVIEAIEVLSGGGPSDTRELCLALASEMLLLGGTASSIDAALDMADRSLSSGRALRKFEEVVSAQGGDARVISDPRGHLPIAECVFDIAAPRSGKVSKMNARAIGDCLKELGAGRKRKEDSIDPRASFRVLKKIGDTVAAGETIAQIYYSEGNDLEAALRCLDGAIDVGDYAEARSLIMKRVRA